MKTVNTKEWIVILIENAKSIQDRIDDLNYKKHTDVKNINDIKSLSEALLNYITAIECLERIDCLEKINTISIK